MRRSAMSLLAVLALCQPAGADDHRWVEVTRPMLACDATDDDGLLRRQFLDFLDSMPKAAPLPANCRRTLQVGEKYILNGSQSEADTQLLVKMWTAACPGGPQLIRPVYAPPRRMVGAYLRLIRTPTACEPSEVQP